MTLKQKIAGADVGLFRNAKGSKETWVLPQTIQTQYQKWMSQKIIFFLNYFVCTLPKHIASIDF